MGKDKLKILIIDDEKQMINVLKESLKEYDVEGYTDAEEIALEWSAQSGKFDHRSFRSLVNSYRDGFFSLGTVYHYATLGGYHA